MPNKVAGRPKSSKLEKSMLLRLTAQQHAALKDFAVRSHRPLTATILYLATTNPEFVQHIRFVPVEVSQ